MDPAVLLDAHLSEPMKTHRGHSYNRASPRRRCGNSPVPTSPEVFDELPECIGPLGQRYDDVDEDAAGVHALALDLHHGTKWPEEHELSEAPRGIFLKHQLINSSPVSLCASQPWDRDAHQSGVTFTR